MSSHNDVIDVLSIWHARNHGKSSQTRVRPPLAESSISAMIAWIVNHGKLQFDVAKCNMTYATWNGFLFPTLEKRCKENFIM